MASKVILTRPAGTWQGFNTIQSAINGAVSGDTVTIYNGTYTEQITIKDGVNMFCLPQVTITSDNAGGTIIDGGNTVNIVLAGEPTITNTGGGEPINLTGAGSDINESNEFGDFRVSGSLDVTGSLTVSGSSAFNLDAGGNLEIGGVVSIGTSSVLTTQIYTNADFDEQLTGELYYVSGSQFITGSSTLFTQELTPSVGQRIKIGNDIYTVYIPFSDTLLVILEIPTSSGTGSAYKNSLDDLVSLTVDNTSVFSVDNIGSTYIRGNVGIGTQPTFDNKLVVKGGISIAPDNNTTTSGSAYAGLIIGGNLTANQLTGQTFSAAKKTWLQNEKATSTYGYQIYTIGSIRADGNMYSSGYLYVEGNTSLYGALTQSNSTSVNSINIKDVYYTTTTDTTPSTQVIDFKDNYLYNYKLSIAAFTTADTASAGYELTGVYYKNGASSSFVATPNIVSIAQGNNFTGSLSASVSSSGEFLLTVTGKDGYTVRWGTFVDATGVKVN